MDNKENLPLRINRIETRDRSENQKQRPIGSRSAEEGHLLVRSCDGNLAACYVMKEHSLKIGRSQLN